MKKFLLNLTFTTLLLSVAYSQCNESNWEEYYPDMEFCDLEDANLSGANLSNAYLYEVNLSGADLCNILTASPNGDVCEESSGITDDNGDGYDDVSFDVGYDEGYISGTSAGDVNLDGHLNITDIILYIEAILAD